MNSGRRFQVIPGARMRWMVTMKFKPVRIDEKPAKKIPTMAEMTLVLQELGAEGRVESPAGIDAAVEDGADHQQAADDVEVPAEQVDAREGEILGADHHRDQKVAQHGGHGGDEEEKDHHLPVHGE